jgi:flagellar biosynthesis/type III secretory pathway M-ring protein FliF/YscJ
MTLRELFNAVKGYDDRLMLTYKASWEQTRQLSTEVRNSNGFSKKRWKPIDVIKFPWDNIEKDRSEEIELIKERRKWRTQ